MMKHKLKTVKQFIHTEKNKIQYYLYKISTKKVIAQSNCSKNKKIVLVSHELSKTGAPVLLLYIAKELALRGYEITVLSKYYGPLFKDFSNYSTVTVIYSKKRLDKVLKILNRQENNLCIVNSVASADWILNIKKNNFKVLTLIHEMPYVIKFLDLSEFADIASNFSDHIIFPSTFVYEKYETISKVNVPVSIFHQGLFIGIDHIPEKETAKKYIKIKYNISENKIILNVATGNYRKGFDFFVYLSKLPLFKDVAFVWVGDISKNYYIDLQLKECKNLYLPGYIDNHDELVSFYDSADIFLLTSREEPFGSVVLEAFNSNLPVIAFNNAGGFMDVVKDGETGYLVDYESIDALKEKINYLLNNDVLLQQLGNNARTVAKECSFSRYIDNLLSVFDTSLKVD